MQMLDLLVIGAGLTGLFAAYTAARSGLRVKVIAMGTGATHWHAGTIDVLGYTPHEEEAVADWVQALPALPTSHPYRLLGVEAIGQALQEFKTAGCRGGAALCPGRREQRSARLRANQWEKLPAHLTCRRAPPGFSRASGAAGWKSG